MLHSSPRSRHELTTTLRAGPESISAILAVRALIAAYVCLVRQRQGLRTAFATRLHLERAQLSTPLAHVRADEVDHFAERLVGHRSIEEVGPVKIARKHL